MSVEFSTKDNMLAPRETNLFKGLTDDEIEMMLSCLKATEKEYSKDSYIFHEGDITKSLGIVLSGEILIMQEDFWGRRNIITASGKNESFGEVFAITGKPLTVSVVAKKDSAILFIDAGRIMNACSSTCHPHNTVIRNLLSDIASKNMKMNEKLSHIARRTTREKILSYLSAEAKKRGSAEFDIPFSHQQLADYLYVDRSGLSLELSKLRIENILYYNRNHFLLYKNNE